MTPRYVKYCLNPIRIRNPRYRDLSRAEASDFVESLHPNPKKAPDGYFVVPDAFLYVPCGRCSHCINTKRTEWRTRLLLEYDKHLNKRCYFVTLTFNPESYKRFVVGKDNKTRAQSIHLFYDRFRKKIGSCRYFFISELGSCSNRFHFHGILFNVPQNVTKETLESIWKYGFVDISRLTSPGAVLYCIKYISKLTTHQPVLRCSLGLGFEKDDPKLEKAIKKFQKGESSRIPREGSTKMLSVPRYYIRKLCPDDIRLILFWQSLEKGFTRYVGGKIFTRYCPEYFDRLQEEFAFSFREGDSFIKKKKPPVPFVPDVSFIDFLNDLPF